MGYVHVSIAAATTMPLCPELSETPWPTIINTLIVIPTIPANDSNRKGKKGKEQQSVHMLKWLVLYGYWYASIIFPLTNYCMPVYFYALCIISSE